MLYVHGYSVQPQEQIQAAMEINYKFKAKGADAFCVPVVWPAEKPFVARTKKFWYGGDNALLVRRAEVWSNRGRAALGRNGLESGYIKTLIDDEGKICEKKCDGWNGQQESRAMRLLGHCYQAEKDALDYYLTQMTDNCD